MKHAGAWVHGWCANHGQEKGKCLLTGHYSGESHQELLTPIPLMFSGQTDKQPGARIYRDKPRARLNQAMAISWDPQCNCSRYSLYPHSQVWGAARIGTAGHSNSSTYSLYSLSLQAGVRALTAHQTWTFLTLGTQFSLIIQYSFLTNTKLSIPKYPLITTNGLW